MKKILGITFGGLQKKAVNLVLVILALSILVFTGVMLYQNHTLTSVVANTRTEQQEAISQSSRDTIYQVLVHSQTESTALRANLADNDFGEVVNNVEMLRTMAEGILGNRDALTPIPVSPPDPALEGRASAYYLCESGADPKHSDSLGLIAHLSSPMIAMWESSDKIDSCYIGLADGTDLCVDEKPRSKYGEDGELIPFPVRQRPWYKGALEADGLYFTGITRDSFSGATLVTCSAPIKVDGQTLGVVGVDIVLSSMADFFSATNDTSFSYVVNAQGQVILGPREGGPFRVELSERAEDLRQAENPDLARFIRLALAGNTELTSLTLEGREYYLAGASMPTLGWAVISVVDKAVTELPEQQLLAEYDRINQEATAKFRADSAATVRFTLLILLAAVVLAFGAALLSTKRMVRPLEEMTRAVVQSSQTGTPFEMKDSYRTNDEMELLAEAFDDLSQKTRRYIEQLTQITQEKERVHTELRLANQIQESMLPNLFPPFPDRPEFDLFASMDPAKEVGGDFYDFFLIDDDHLCLVIADVSGKGVPAALFMMISKVIVQSCAMLGRSPAEILTKTNEALCSNNQVQMFVTVWLGVLEISTGRLTCANAGHEYPVLKQPGGEFALFKDKHGFVIGGMEGMKYHEYSLQLEPGAKLFVYTDGVPEATDGENRLFGTERMLEALNRETESTPRQILERVRAAVDEFVGTAEQFDDLTMLCLEYRGSARTAPGKELRVEASLESIPQVTEFVNRELEALGCPPKTRMQMDVAIDEIMSNIARYAYGGGRGSALIRLETQGQPRGVWLSFIDRGSPFNPLAAREPDLSLPLEERTPGGLGIFLVRKTMDELQYERVEDQNVLRLMKRLPEQPDTENGGTT